MIAQEAAVTAVEMALWPLIDQGLVVVQPGDPKFSMTRQRIFGSGIRLWYMSTAGFGVV